MTINLVRDEYTGSLDKAASVPGGFRPRIKLPAARVFTHGETRTAMTSSTLLQIPVNYRYAPSSDESLYKTCTLYIYIDGWLQIFTGCQKACLVTLQA